ncbi:MAG: hypothetical protein K2P37_03170 [Oscillospiraceae bacterium]|nr:hypothetical protein [Oscillospiraceae bacterium]
MDTQKKAASKSPASGRLCSRAFFRALEVVSKKEIYLSYSLLTSEIGSDIFVLRSDK